MRVVFLSDTHGRHGALTVPPCDLLVHAGDWSGRGTRAETEDFLGWLGAQPAGERLVVAGNHDRWVEAEPDVFRQRCRENGVRALFDEGAEVLGFKVWGSPYTPKFGDWAFQGAPGEEMARHFATMPAGLDLLVTHGPPLGVQDRTLFGNTAGCEALAQAVVAKTPALHVFGHIHEAHGEGRLGQTRCLNICNAQLLARGLRPPQVEDLRPRAC